jgi:hypothetical protein
LRLKSLSKKYSEAKDSYWDIISGCSWYCGAWPKSIKTSSSLKSQNGNTYKSKNIHDLNYKNAWVEGVDGNGIGEFIEYTFSGESPRITDIFIVNGYVKNEQVWKNNARVKKLKLYINNQAYAILNLKDSRSEQRFKVEPIGNGDRTNKAELKLKPDWKLKFEVLEVYPETKFQDLAISEIYFDGIDVH